MGGPSRSQLLGMADREEECMLVHKERQGQQDRDEDRGTQLVSREGLRSGASVRLSFRVIKS